MNIIIYKLIFNNNNWDPGEKIHTLLINNLHKEDLTLKNIYFSSFLYDTNLSLFPDEKKKSSFNKIKRKLLHFFSIIWNNLFLNNLQKEEHCL